MNKYFTTKTIERSCNIGDGRTVIYCDNSRESIETVCKLFHDATPITRKHALELVWWERRLHRIGYGFSPDSYHSAYIYPYWWNMGQAIDETDSTGCVVIR